MPRKIPSSQASILKLRKAGMTDTQIGKAIGRDSSLISQISRGNKPGKNLQSSLDSLSRGKKPRKPKRRTTSSGEEAGVRRVREAEVKSLGAAELLKRLRTIAGADGYLYLNSRWSEGVRISPGQSPGESTIRMKGKTALKSLEGFMKRHPKYDDKKMLREFMAYELKAAHPHMPPLTTLERVDVKAIYKRKGEKWKL